MKTITRTLARTGLGVAPLLFVSAVAAAECTATAGKLASLQGAVEVMSATSGQWRAGKLGETLCQGDTIRVGDRGRAAISLNNEAVLRVDQNSTLRLTNVPVEEQERSWLDLLKGAVQSFSRKPRTLTINTPYLNGSIEGTEFVFRVDDNASQLTVFEGTVVAANNNGTLPVPAGSAVVAAKGQAPQPRVLVKPRDEVQWALYYPAVLTTDSNATSDISRAAQLLEVGRVDEARPLIEHAIAATPNNGAAYALRAVIAVVQNQTAEALAAGEKAVELDSGVPGSIALSYAHQASFRIEAARDVMQSAVGKHAANGLAWARLAELQLMLGDREAALAAAREAERLAPNLARTQLVVGFAELGAFDTAQARTAFARAIELDSADPLAHLGLGLAQISGGKLQAGRHEIELAVALDGSSALLRAYLGKAYFEERRDGLDGQQFAIAKELDPNDPTAFLYDGISKQAANRPIDALDDVSKSIALNDNRAVYRSRLLLDKDHAARGASVARVYDDLGFAQQGLNAATASLSLDPTNSSAHQFLADVYQSQRRREIARVSEQLQAQMLQDVSVAPVQPSVSQPNLNAVTLGGPAQAGFNEFTPLFARNQATLNIAASGGSQGTQSGEASVSGQFDRYSFSLGALDYRTDGWRPNNTLQQTLYGLFGQVALTDRVNAQIEYRQRDSTEGDLAFNFDPEDFIADKRIRRKAETSRVGVRLTLSPASQLLASYMRNHRDEDIHEVRVVEPVVGVTTFTNMQHLNDHADASELQWLRTWQGGNTVLGAALSDSDRVDDSAISIDDSIIGNLVADGGQDKIPTKDQRAYGYFNTHSADAVNWTIGGSYTRFEHTQLTLKDERTVFSPKLGLRWHARSDVEVRAAAFQSLKPVLVSNRSLEPTQLAGFSQVFDDINGAKSRGYGVGFDWRPQTKLTGGVELTRRKINEPILDVGGGLWRFEDHSEDLHRIYANWTPTAQVAVHAEGVFDKFDNSEPIVTEFGMLNSEMPLKVITRSAPVTVSYFGASGVFATLGVTYVDQMVRRSRDAQQASGEDNFVTVDPSIGYRFAKRRGVVSIGAKNVFDTQFKYQDDSYRESRDEPSVGPYFPVRTVVAGLTLAF